MHGETTMSSIEIRNVLGAILLQSTIASEKIILDLSMHAKGIYFYKDETLTGASKSGKIIVR